MGKQVITADDIQKLSLAGNNTLDVCETDCIITPGARDKIEELGIRFRQSCMHHQSKVKNPETSLNNKKAYITDNSQVDLITDQVCALVKQNVGHTAPPGLTDMVKKIVASKLSASSEAETDSSEKCSALRTRGGVSLIQGNHLLDDCSGPDIPGKVLISDAIRCHNASHLTATYMKWEKTSFDRTVESPEISIVLEGEMDILVDGKTLKATAGDIIYMDKGASVTYDSASGVKLACVN